MTANNYHTIFELGFRSFPWVKLAHPLIFLALGLVFIRLSKRKTYYLAVGLFVVSIASIVLFMSLVVFIPKFVTLRSAYVSGKGAVVEGIVQNFRPAPMIGPASESFSVNGISFSYNALDNTPCFHDAPLHKGPIREGLRVRIRYDDGCIQRIDAL